MMMNNETSLYVESKCGAIVRDRILQCFPQHWITYLLTNLKQTIATELYTL